MKDKKRYFTTSSGKKANRKLDVTCRFEGEYQYKLD